MKSRISFIVLVLILAFLREGRGENPSLAKFGSSLTHYVSFDQKGTDAELSNGTATDGNSSQGGVEFVPGLQGQGVVFTAPKRVIQYEADAIADLGQPGAVAFWVAAYQWDRSLPEEYVFFLRIASEGGMLLIGKSNLQGRSDFLYALYQATGEAPPVSVRLGGTQTWEDGEWHLIVLNWGADSMELSVDNSELSFVNVPGFSRQGKAKWVMLGAGRLPNRNVAFDELMTFNRPLTQHEIAEIYANRSGQNP